VIYGAVFLLSLSSLAYEVLLARVFAFTQWHHLAFLVISIAVFGFGAGGAVVSLAEAGRAGAPRGGLASRLTDPSRPAGLGLLCLLFCLSGSASLAFLLAVPLDYFRLPVEARSCPSCWGGRCRPWPSRPCRSAPAGCTPQAWPAAPAGRFCLRPC
jgi:hypothetical protein